MVTTFKTHAIIAMTFVLVHSTAFPQQAEEDTAELEPMVVVASKAPRPVSEVAAQVTVIEAEELDRKLLEDLDDLMRYQPGLEAERSGTRFGFSGISIRGVGGNRVSVEVDGVPLRDRFAVGSYSNATQNLIDTRRLKRVEILHGPASSLYGSDALGGVMAITTFDPDDYVSRGQGSHWFNGRSSWREEDSSWSLTGTAAWAEDSHGLMVASTRREGHETDHNNDQVPSVDPQNWTSEDHAFRYTYDTPAANRLRLSVSRFNRESDTEITSILGYSRFRNTSKLSGHDEDESSRVLLDYEFANDAFEHGVLRAWTGDTHTRQLTLESRTSGRNPSHYERYFDYQSKQDGAQLNLFRGFAAGRSDHRLGLGLEWSRTRSEEFRDGWQQIIASGFVTTTVLGETMPVRDFPNSEATEMGLFVQDEISLGDWQIIPALRWDRFEVDPRLDAMYLEDYPDFEVVSISDDRVTPRLGLVRAFSDGWSAYAQYVEGFRAPPHEDANIGFDISIFRYRAIANPDLKPERSRGWETGVRKISADTQLSIAAFETDFRDFIESRVPVGTDPQTGYLLFQSRNIGEASIRGLDIRFDQNLGTWSEKLAGLQLSSALYWSEGNNGDSAQPLNSISPPQAVVGVDWDSPSQRWSLGLIGTFTQAQTEVDHSDGARFETPGYSIFDLSAGWRAAPGVDLRVGIRNLTNRHYWRWADVSRLNPADPMLQLLSRPGRSISLSVNIGW